MIRRCLFFLLFYPLFTEAQQPGEYTFRHIDQRNGLLHNVVFAMAQDSKGFVWIITANGLKRYDGLRFKNYEKELRAFSYTIPIKNIYEDKEKNILITGNQVGSINTLQNSATIYNEPGALKNPKEKFVAYTDEKNNKWLLSNYRVCFTDSLSGQMRLFAHHTPKTASSPGNLIYADNERKCTWIINFHDLMMFDERTKQVYTPTYIPLHNPVVTAFADKLISFILIESRENIWAAEWGSYINKYDAKHNLVPFYKDFETLQLYIELEQFRTGNKFTYTMNADDELMDGDYKVPSLLVQPFVENAIHNGLLDKLHGERNLSIHALVKPATILYLISDNGVGRRKVREIKQQNKPEHNSYGIEISSQRIQLHNQNGHQNDIVIKDISCEEQAAGTEVATNIIIDNP
jgi:hypothetical protein